MIVIQQTIEIYFASFSPLLVVRQPWTVFCFVEIRNTHSNAPVLYIVIAIYRKWDYMSSIRTGRKEFLDLHAARIFTCSTYICQTNIAKWCKKGTGCDLSVSPLLYLRFIHIIGILSCLSWFDMDQFYSYHSGLTHLVYLTKAMGSVNQSQRIEVIISRKLK